MTEQLTLNKFWTSGVQIVNFDLSWSSWNSKDCVAWPHCLVPVEHLRLTGRCFITVSAIFTERRCWEEQSQDISCCLTKKPWLIVWFIKFHRTVFMKTQKASPQGYTSRIVIHLLNNCVFITCTKNCIFLCFSVCVGSRKLKGNSAAQG